MKTILRLILLIFCCILPNFCSAQDPFLSVKDGLRKFTLPNGLRVLFLRREVAPVFAAQVWVRVGGVDEVPGTTGVAHLLEHMAFKGTDKIGTKDFASEQKLLARLDELMARTKVGEQEQKEISEINAELEKIWVDNEFAKIYSTHGGVGVNAATSKDTTNYTLSLPNSEFELWCWMESERILNPVFRQFYKERDVVREERRSSVDDSPGGKMFEVLMETAFASHPNRLPVVGWASDIEQLTTQDLVRLYRAYYRPDNMVLALVGDLEEESVYPLVKKYFGRIPPGIGPIPRPRNVEAVQSGPRESVVYFNAEQEFISAYHKPTYPHPDDAYFAILHSVLGEGRSSILFKELVLDKQIASSVYTSEGPGELFDNLFAFGGTPKKGVSNEELREEILKILERLKSKPISHELLTAAKRRVRVSLLKSLTSNEGLARMLARGELLWNDWQAILKSYDRFQETTSEDLMRLLSTYVRRENETYIRLEKKGS